MITSPRNARIQEARKLHRKRRRQQTGQLLLEGVRLIQDALSAGVQPHQIFYVPDLVESNPLTHQILRQTDSRSVERIACTQSAFGVLAETVTPQGIAAVVPMPHLTPPTAPTLTLLLDGIGDPGNAGTLLRSAEAAGVDHVLFAPHTVDPFNDKVLRAAMGAHFRLPLSTCDSWDEVRQALSPQQRCYVATAAASPPYDEVDWTQPAALLIGSETDGPSPDAHALATPIAIPMHGATESLNAGVAGAVILFEAARQRRRAQTD